MATFSRVLIIYNPKSKGNSKTKAEALQKRLKKLMPDTPISCMPTKRAGHAEQLAYKFTGKYPHPLLISVSGDGGYNEVINGAMRAADGGKTQPVCAVLPAGNANDHSHTMHQKPLRQALKKGKISQIDLIKVHINSGGKSTSRYAHSYVGVGLSPMVAAELNRHQLNPFKEMALVAKTFFKYEPFHISQHGKIRVLDSLIFTNIDRMAKVLTLAKKNRPDDGLFEVITIPHGRKLLFLNKMLRAATIGLKITRQDHDYQFKVMEDMPIQLDGEVTNVPAGSTVHIVSANKALSTII